MILPLRRRHRRMFAVIGVLLPVAFVAGIAARRPAPSSALLPAGLSATAGQFTATEWERGDLFTNTPIRVRLLRETSTGGKFGLNLSTTTDFAKADLLVYWVAGNRRITDTLPDAAILLGAFQSNGALPLPAEAAGPGGLLVLYSLADQKIVAASNPLVIQ